MKTSLYQRGMSMPVIVLIIAIGGFFLLCAFKLVPLYAENRYIVAALESLGEDPDLASMSKNEITSELGRFYNINNVRSEGSRNIEVEKKSGKVLVTVNYETRVPLFLNIDVVVSFENQLDSSVPDQCCNPIE